ncbi:MAG: UDP-N-acetylmuramoyl-L-alanine--D-glutamate ligase [Leptolyngbyaceae bacterium]|nr:UDP-N-acetylmuramoyl-L-alanine--D-glutamate ligase [Leptolyngbyaceae bacterium]
MKHSYVIGLGKSGVAAARLLKAQGWSVTISDRNHSDALTDVKTSLNAEGIEVNLGDSFVPDANQMQQIVVSPGVPWDLPILTTARELGIPTLGEMELAWRSLQSCPWVGITGTNGKTTVTSLIAAIFQSGGLTAPSCGNIGNAASELALEHLNSEASLDWVIAEISSYQIESSSTLAPEIGVWTTFTPDHLSRHKTLENYFAIKANLVNRSTAQVLNGDDPYLRRVGDRLWPDAIWTSTTGAENLVAHADKGAYIDSEWVMMAQEKIVPVKALRMVGDHNQQNLLMAVAVARLAGIDKEAIAHAIETFPGVPHRLEHICTWQGIDFINDSKATNYDASEVGLRAVASPAVLIAGGEAKDGDDRAWIEMIQQKATSVVLIGSAADYFSQRLTQSGFSAYEVCSGLDDAVPRAAELAKDQGARIVLLSPACASFDQYANFEDRGNHFRSICLKHFGV